MMGVSIKGPFSIHPAQPNVKVFVRITGTTITTRNHSSLIPSATKVRQKHMPAGAKRVEVTNTHHAIVAISRQRFFLNKYLRNIEMIGEHMELCSQVENRSKTVCDQWREAESDAIMARRYCLRLFVAVLPLHN